MIDRLGLSQNLLAVLGKSRIAALFPDYCVARSVMEPAPLPPSRLEVGKNDSRICTLIYETMH